MPRVKRSAVAVQKPFPVMLLPPELRNRIWRYAVVKEGDVRVQKHLRQELASNLPASRLRSGYELRLHQEDDQRCVASKLAVAFTCRQLYLEVTHIYYRENTFYLPWQVFPRFMVDRDEIAAFAKAIGSENAASILSLGFDGYTCFDGYHPYFPSLERLEVATNPHSQFCNRDWISGMISYVQKHPSMVVTRNGKVWGLQEWVSYAESERVTWNW